MPSSPKGEGIFIKNHYRYLKKKRVFTDDFEVIKLTTFLIIVTIFIVIVNTPSIL